MESVIRKRPQALSFGAMKKTSKCNHAYIRCAGQYRTYTCVYCGRERKFGNEIKFTHARWAL